MSKGIGIALLFVVLLVFCVYFFTSAPGLGLIDSGELTTVAYTLGIAHPSGYPLYSLVGHLFSYLPLGYFARRMVVFSVLCMAASCGFLLLAGMNLASNRFRLAPFPSLFCACAGVLIFAFSTTTWQSAAYAEVYPLTLLFVSVLYFLGVQLLDDTKRDMRLWLTFAFIFGLALGNHLTVLWTFPLGLVTLFFTLRQREVSLGGAGTIAAAAIFGASIVLFLPLRAHLNPIMNWGNPETPAMLWRHLSGWQYQVWMFQKGIAERLGGYFEGLPAEFGWGGLVFILLGVFGLAKWGGRVLVAFLLLWFVGVLYNVNYDIPDIAPYFMTAHAALAILAVGGAATLWKMVSMRTRVVQILAILCMLFPVVSNAVGHFSQANRSNDRFATTFTREVLRTLPSNALVMQSLWDIQSPAIYLQEVEGYRRDAVLMDINLMQRRWYVEQLARKYPDVVADCEPQLRIFLKELEPFDAGQAFDATRIERAFVALHDSIISKNLTRRPVYLRFVVEAGHPEIGAKFPAQPASFFYRLGAAQSDEDFLDIEKIIAHRTEFDDRECYLLAKVLEILRHRRVSPGTEDRVSRQMAQINEILNANSRDPKGP
jgi:hypothetical protein